MPTLSDNQQQYVINSDSVFLNNNNDAHNSHIVIKTKGAVNENDIEFQTCNIKILDGDLTTKKIKDLSGNTIMTIGENSLDFNNVSVNNLNFASGSLNADNVASANGYASLDLELDAHLALINGKVSQNGHTANKIFVSSNGGALTTTGNCTVNDLLKLNSGGAVDLNTAKVGITTQQANDIVANTAKIGITTQQANDIVANTAKIGITTQQANEISANTAKVGISTQQANEIIANTAKVGITSSQANQITTNASNIASNVLSINSIDAGRIANANAIAINSSNISTNTTNIVTNTGKVTGLGYSTLSTYGDVFLTGGDNNGVVSGVKNNGDINITGGYDGANASGHIIFNVNNSEAMRVKNDGNVGIGETSPSAKLHVSDSILIDAYAGDKGIFFRPGFTTNALYNISILAYRDGDTSGDTLSINAFDGITFCTGSNSRNERMRVERDGYVGIGTTSPTHPLTVFGSVLRADFGNNAATYWADNASGNWDDDSNGTGNNPMSIKADKGILSMYGYWTQSDSRIKKNIVEIDDSSSLQKLRDISCCSYKYIDEEVRGSSLQVGFIAQQVREYFPHAITLEKEFVPDKLDKITDALWNETTLSSESFVDVSGIKYKFYVFDTGEETQREVNLVGNSDNTFTFNKIWDYVFCYGREVDDFHILDKAKLFALNFSATQELDKKVTQLEKTIEFLKAKLTIIENS